MEAKGPKKAERARIRVADASRSPKGRYHHGNVRQELMAATLQIVAEKGVEKVSLREAAHRIGVAPSAPFRHFASRNALLLAIAEEGIARLAQAYAPVRATAGQAPPLDHIQALGHAYLGWAYDNALHLQILWTPLFLDSSASTFIVETSVELLDMWESAFRAAACDMRPGVDPVMAAFAARTQMYGLARMWTDGTFYEEGYVADPVATMRAAFSHHIDGLRRR